MTSPARRKPPPINTQRLSVHEPSTPSASSSHRCPCKRIRSPNCNCPHDKGCALRSARPTPSTTSSIKSPFGWGKYTSTSAPTSTGSTASPAYKSALLHNFASGSTLQSPSPRPSAYDFGYDGAMSLYSAVPMSIPTAMKRTDSVSVIKGLPRDVTRTFSGRVGRRNKRPKDIKVVKANEFGDVRHCVCEMECDCRCWTLSSPIATRHSPMFDRDVIR